MPSMDFAPSSIFFSSSVNVFLSWSIWRENSSTGVTASVSAQTAGSVELPMSNMLETSGLEMSDMKRRMSTSQAGYRPSACSIGQVEIAIQR